MGESRASLHFRVQGQTHERQLAVEPVTLGRDPGNDVVVLDPAVSRHHAIVSLRADGRYVLRDVGSSHGTYVRGRRIAEYVLEDEDEVLMGSTRIQFRDASAEASSNASPRATVPPTQAPFAPRIQSAYEIPALEALQRQYEKLRVALELARSIGNEEDLDALLQRILETALELTGADCGAVLLTDEAQTVVSEARRWRGDAARSVFPSTHIVREVIEKREPVVTLDPLADQRFQRAESIIMQGVHAVVSVPLLVRDEAIGVLQLEWRGAPRRVEDRDIELALALAAQAALAIRSAVVAERARREKAAQWAQLERALRGLPVGLVVLDAHRRVAMTNALGDDFLARARVERTAPVTAFGPTTLEALVRASERGAAEIVLDGPRRQLVAISAARAREEGAPEETVLVLRDVSAERERETQLSRHERQLLVGRLAGGIAHDFNNILAVITSCAEMLTESAIDEDARVDAAEILREARRGAALVRQLMEFNRREPGQIEPIDLAEVVEGMGRLIARTLGSDCALEIEVARGLGLVRADRTKLEQLLLNFIVNARDAMPKGGRLKISSSRVELLAAGGGPERDLAIGPHVVLEVADTGIGIAPEILERIFEPYFTTKTSGDGTGLGLATVYGIVKQMGGSIGVRSSVGEGTTFSVFLPVTEPVLEQEPTNA